MAGAAFFFAVLAGAAFFFAGVTTDCFFFGTAFCFALMVAAIFAQPRRRILRPAWIQRARR